MTVYLKDGTRIKDVGRVVPVSPPLPLIIFDSEGKEIHPFPKFEEIEYIGKE